MESNVISDEDEDDKAFAEDTNWIIIYAVCDVAW